MIKNIIISIDDISPHKYSGYNCIETCKNLVKKNNNIKFVLFIPLAYFRLKETQWKIQDSTITVSPLKISEYHEFCNTLKLLPKENFQLAYHGYLHAKIGNCWPKSNNYEFEELNYNETIEKIELMNNEINKANLTDKFSKIFRPPGWKISNEGMKALLDNKFTIELNKNIEYDFSDLNMNNIYFYDFSPPEVLLDNKIDDVHIVYHACEWLKNYFTEIQFENLLKFYENYELKFMFCKEFIKK